MKKILTLLSALFIITGLKAQKVVLQKETVNPKTDTLAKKINVEKSSKTAEKKEIKNVSTIKHAPLSKVIPITTKVVKVTTGN
ncbi:uncharacterized protein YcfL [Pedobacter africanus]|uniref:Uncharacterized protein YcfL n=1 Tax=Pedobacter africanus TaxID=151894 RepID=A0ACC6L0R5_9SPHI|nr:hypothetical protein [Pedobacter africanus]MDR6784957.1 uncharacterized protein YcfL [Pedobacter africanus]